MKNRALPLFALVLTGVFTACTSLTSRPAAGLLSANILDLVQNAVFEVVTEKPTEDLVNYEKELNWDNVPFVIRNDRYYSIGTAFAISKTELVTAFHVINLGYESMVFPKYFIRDSQGNVYEVDQVSGGSNEKDYLIFTVKDKTFDKFFQLERNFKTGDPVYSIGNALGEGIVVRNGLLLGTIPEADSGRWNLLKSSADGNPGNSGGPLVRPDGKVVALVTLRQDNIIYSLPAGLILDSSRSELPYRIKYRMGHLILDNKLNGILETSAPLPDSYAGIRKKLRADYEKNYNASMTTLFKEAPEYIKGPNNVFLLDSSLSSSFPEISFIDPNDNNWKLSTLNRSTKSYSLDDDGRLIHVEVSGINFYKIKRPKSVPLENICTDPKYIMDLILQNIRTDRTLWDNDKYRILSYNKPSSTGLYTDELKRTWLTANWVIGFSDDVQIMYILPMPDGPVVISTRQDSSFLQDFEWDMRKICDHVYAAYNTTFEDWITFTSKMSKYTPGFIKDVKLNWDDKNQAFSLDCGGISINSDSNVFDWSLNSEMFLAPSWYKQNNVLKFGFRKIILNKNPWNNDFIVIYRNIMPDQKLGTRAMENWNNLITEKNPFNGLPAISVKDNTASIGVIVNFEPPQKEAIFSVYLSMQNNTDEENLLNRFTALRKSILIKE